MHPTHARIDLSALSHNLAVAARMAPGSRNLAVIKADAYGHGAVRAAKALSSHADALAVAFVDEALELRESGIDTPILVLQGVFHPDQIDQVLRHNLWLMIHSPEQVEWLVQHSPSSPFPVWLKLDTGMHRLGLHDAALDTVVSRLCDAGWNVEVLCTHLANADQPEDEFVHLQNAAVRAAGTRLNLPVSIANSAGILNWPETHAAWNRPGYMLYGNHPSAGKPDDDAGLIPVMTLASGISAVRRLKRGESVGYGQIWTAEQDAIIATIPVGYADGYPRHAGNGTPVWINGQKAPLVGRVSMDMITVDVSGIESAVPGTPVECWGKNLSINEVAIHAGTIGYELMTGISTRIPLVY